MQQLRKTFISSNKEFTEGDVLRFVQDFSVEDIISATLNITALGIYNVELNNQRIGDQLFAPGYTYYPKHLNVQSYDILNLLQPGNNQLVVYVAQGWYAGRFTHENKTKLYGDTVAVSWELQLVNTAGEKQQITSLDHVLESTSEYLYAGFYDGEIVDKNIIIEPIGPAQKYKGNLPENFEKTILPVLQQEKMNVISAIETSDGWIIDFDQNFAGYIEIDSKLMNNSTIHIHHGEILNPDNTIYTKNLRKAKAKITYTKGDYDEIYKPSFTYMGFRYIHIKGCTYKDGLIHAYSIYSDISRSGYFTSANYLVQKLYQNQLWGQKSNYIEVPTDCPQRDERMGYTGDAQAFARTGMYNFDTRKFWKKVLKDISYSQQDNTEGYVGPHTPAIGPAGIGYINMLGWGNAVTIIPEALYQQYGDESFLNNQYDSMKKHVEAEIRQLGDNYLWMGINLGDWLAPGKDVSWFAMNNHPVSNSFIVNDLRILSEYSLRHGLQEDYNRYHDYYLKIRKSYINTFIKDDGVMQPEYQGAYVMALQYVLQGHPLRNRVMKQFVKHVQEFGLETGFFATEYLLPLLVEANEIKLAFDILLNENNPGWMYQIKKGATTTWERWDGIMPDNTVNEVKLTDDNMVSFNHYAFGSIGRFYYQYILGIKPKKPGYEEVIIQPYLDSRLIAVSGMYDSVNGKIQVSWELTGEKYYLQVQVPMKGILILPDGKKEELHHGNYEFHGTI